MVTSCSIGATLALQSPDCAAEDLSEGRSDGTDKSMVADMGVVGGGSLERNGTCYTCG